MATTERRAGGTDDGAERLTVAPVVGPDDPRRFTDSGIEIDELYTEADLPEQLDLGRPGEFPFTRGIHPGMYRRQTWTMRQYAGYASATESNERYRYLLSKGTTGLSMAFDLPTQLGLDSDNPRCLGEVGRTGVAIDTIDDMRSAFDGIPLEQVSTSMTINAPAACLLLLYELVGEEQGVPSDKLRGARRMWAQIMRVRFGATNPKATMLRFHTQTGGVTLTAQQPENNIVRVALQGFAAVCGGTQSLHTNGFDEALALPSERAAKIALRTQQILAHESGAADTVDPFAGSYFVESLTDEIEARARELIERIDALGGSVHAIEFITGEIDESAWGYQERYRIGQDIVVGVNAYQEDDVEVPDLLRVDPDSERQQVERLREFKAARDHELVQRRLEELRAVAQGSENLLRPIRQALKDRCSLGEVCGAMQDVFGRYAPTF